MLTASIGCLLHHDFTAFTFRFSFEAILAWDRPCIRRLVICFCSSAVIAVPHFRGVVCVSLTIPVDSRSAFRKKCSKKERLPHQNDARAKMLYYYASYSFRRVCRSCFASSSSIIRLYFASFFLLTVPAQTGQSLR